jgi:hypothetical protein
MRHFSLSAAFVAAVVLIATVTLTGCKKSETPNGLSGTRWIEHRGGSSTTLTFKSNTACQFFISASSDELAPVVECTYTYDHPVVKMYSKAAIYADLTGTIDGSKMLIINTSTGRAIASLTKQ